jgi:hypothetical protein
MVIKDSAKACWAGLGSNGTDMERFPYYFHCARDPNCAGSAPLRLPVGKHLGAISGGIRVKGRGAIAAVIAS